MPEKNQDEITYDGLKRFLRRVGFDQSAKIENSLVFHHHKSETMIVLSVPEDGQTVRSADLLSMLVRLETQGLVDDSDLEQFKNGKLPMAS